MSQIEIPPELQELVRKLNRVEEMLTTLDSTLRATQDYLIAVKAEVVKLVRVISNNQKNHLQKS